MWQGNVSLYTQITHQKSTTCLWRMSQLMIERDIHNVMRSQDRHMGQGTHDRLPGPWHLGWRCEQAAPLQPHCGLEQQPCAVGSGPALQRCSPWPCMCKVHSLLMHLLVVQLSVAAFSSAAEGSYYESSPGMAKAVSVKSSRGLQSPQALCLLQAVEALS